eukprot:UN20033
MFLSSPPSPRPGDGDNVFFTVSDTPTSVPAFKYKKFQMKVVIPRTYVRRKKVFL